MTAQHPLANPSDLARQLKAIRLESGLSGKQLADTLDWQASKVSRIENGKQMPSVDDITAWTGACNTAPEVAARLRKLRDEAQTQQYYWNARLQQGQAAVQMEYAQMEKDAKSLRQFDMTYIPGPLQTPDYARCVLTLSRELMGVNVDESDLNLAVATRMRRQQILYETDKEFQYVLGESSLRWGFCPRPVMLAQLDRLQTIIGMPNIRFGILPLNTPIPTAPRNSFQIYGDLAVVESFSGEIVYRGDEFEKLSQILDLLWEGSVTEEAARQLIIRVADDLRKES